MPKSIPTLIAPNFRPDAGQCGTTRGRRRAVGGGTGLRFGDFGLYTTAPGEATMTTPQLHRVGGHEEAW
ncbi:hypothetical protein [Mycobacterium persicum]|uniref:hypothetical protein n=1 Tax=Mycobacterium persicum TaxID=1487726 RepID=UPI0010420535|nr:hypothetical protein [Mycobacterium persicum]